MGKYFQNSNISKVDAIIFFLLFDDGKKFTLHGQFACRDLSRVMWRIL